MEQAENILDLVKSYIGPNKEIIDTKITNLTSPGENYMSEIVKIDVIVENPQTGDSQNLNLVAKLVINNEVIDGGNTSSINKNEVLFYTEILPTLQDFLKRHDMPALDIFAPFVAGRMSTNDTDIVDGNGILILENLSTKGYKNVDRTVGFDGEGAKLILKDLAKFHAVPLALRLLEPEVFETKIRSNAAGFKANVSTPSNESAAFALFSVFPLMAKILKSDEKYSAACEKFEEYTARLKTIYETEPNRFFSDIVKDDFETLIHHDLWTNNTMQLYEDGVPVKNVLLDMQMCECNTPVSDLLFFLITSVRIPYLFDHFDELIQFYYDNLALMLKLLGCLGPEHVYTKFLEAMKRGVSQTMVQCMFMMMTVIFGEKGQQFDQSKTNDVKPEDVPQQAKDKLGFLFLEASKRGWL